MIVVIQEVDRDQERDVQDRHIVGETVVEVVAVEAGLDVDLCPGDEILDTVGQDQDQITDVTIDVLTHHLRQHHRLLRLVENLLALPHHQQHHLRRIDLSRTVAAHQLIVLDRNPCQ